MPASRLICQRFLRLPQFDGACTFLLILVRRQHAAPVVCAHAQLKVAPIGCGVEPCPPLPSAPAGGETDAATWQTAVIVRVIWKLHAHNLHPVARAGISPHIASLYHFVLRRLPPNNSSKPTPLRSAA